MTKIDFQRAFRHILPNVQPGRNMYLKIIKVTNWNNDAKSSITIELVLVDEHKEKISQKISTRLYFSDNNFSEPVFQTVDWLELIKKNSKINFWDELNGKYLIADAYLQKNKYWSIKPILIIN